MCLVPSNLWEETKSSNSIIVHCFKSHLDYTDQSFKKRFLVPHAEVFVLSTVSSSSIISFKIRTHTYTHIEHMHTYTYTCMQTHTYITHAHIYTHTHTHMYTHSCTHTCMHAHTNTYMHTNKNQKYKYAHTYTHRQCTILNKYKIMWFLEALPNNFDMNYPSSLLLFP